MHAEVMLDPVCNVSVSGESRETKDWPPATFWKLIEEWSIRLCREVGHVCCDMGQNDTIGKIELNPSFVLSSNNTNYKNDIQ